MTEYEKAIEDMKEKYDGGYIGVDLDGTLAEHHIWIGPYHIGKPVPKMVERVKRWLAEGIEVRIITARAEPIVDGKPDPAVITVIQDWCEHNLGKRLAVSNGKTYGMVELWDDRAVGVIPNTGRRADGKKEDWEITPLNPEKLCMGCDKEIDSDRKLMCPSCEKDYHEDPEAFK